MAPSAQVQRAQAAVRAMKLIGFDPRVAKAVLKKLLKVYENNWEYIESENYRLLADSILDDQESTNPEDNEKDAAFSDEPELSRKRLRRKQDDQDPGPLPLAIESDVSAETLIKRPKLVASAEGPLTNLRGKSVIPEEAQCSGEGKSASLSPQPLLKSGAIGEMETHKSHNYEEPSSSLGYRVPRSTKSLSSERGAYSEKGESGLFSMYNRDKEKLGGKSRNAVCYKKPKIEPDIEVLQETAVVDSSTIPDDPMDEVCSDIYENYDLPLLPCHAISYGISDSNMQVAPNNTDDAESLKVSAQKETISEFACVQETLPTNLEIASSNMGEVKLLLTCSSDCPDFKMLSIEYLFKIVEDRCLKSYKILQPNFSLIKLLKEVCQCAVDLAAESGKDPQEDVVKVTLLMEPLKRSHSPHRMTIRSFNDSLDLFALKIPRVCMKGLLSGQNIDGVNNEMRDNRALDSSCQNASQSLAVIPQQQHPISAPRPLHDESDIAKGEERVKISLINEYTGEKFPPFFHYIPQNVTYQKAHVNISLARIGDEDCCLNCFDDCLSASIPCACTRETDGKFVYTPDGLLKKEFLNDCISVNCYPDKHHLAYCKDCPIEKSKNEHVPDICKGHIVRKFIKECWSKCGCNKQCGNRVVQRGITLNLQVFYTSDGKGWGLRPLEELPRGAFVCEYVGEILTNIELYNRAMEKTGSAKHTYPVLLDVDWGSTVGLRDEETLCLDSTFFGNVGRFVNHRCLDANLVEVPVEWETPDHHYYHLAFFTARKVEALEELTWDYGIDFADRKHPIKAFKCLCGSRFCRDRSKDRRRSSFKLRTV